MPLKQLKRYWLLAHKKKDLVADNLSLATVDKKGRPHVRTVLIKILDKRGIGFVTQSKGPKVEQFKASKTVECCMAWPKLWLQVRVTGKVKPMPKTLVKKFWAMRPREAQLLYTLGIPQSSEIPSFEFLLRRVADLAVTLRHRKIISPSPNYVGFLIQPTRIEFLHHNPSRLNRRELYQKTSRGWTKTILAP